MDNYDDEIAFENNSNWRADAAQRVRDKIADHRARTVKEEREWFMDPDVGIPYFKGDESYALTFPDQDTQPIPAPSWEDLTTNPYAPHDVITREVPALSSEMVTSQAYGSALTPPTDPINCRCVVQWMQPQKPQFNDPDSSLADKCVAILMLLFILAGLVCAVAGWAL